MTRPLVVFLLILSVGCAPRRVYTGPRLPRTEIARIGVRKESGARLQAINGRRVSSWITSPTRIELAAGDSTLAIVFRHAKKQTPIEIRFNAEAGHFYELAATESKTAPEGWVPVLVDNSTQTQLFPLKH